MVVQQSLGLAERLRVLGPVRDVEVQVSVLPAAACRHACACCEWSDCCYMRLSRCGLCMLTSPFMAVLQSPPVLHVLHQYHSMK